MTVVLLSASSSFLLYKLALQWHWTRKKERKKEVSINGQYLDGKIHINTRQRFPIEFVIQIQHCLGG